MAKKTSFAKTQKALDKLFKGVSGNKIDVAALTGAELMLQIVKAQTPVDSGRLRESLYIDKSGRGSIRGAPGRLSNLAVENVYCTIATNVHYAWFVEYGTRNMTARPFMRPAFDSAARPVADAVFSTVESFVTSILVQAL